MERRFIGLHGRSERINTLTVGESTGFAALGGIINLTLDDNKLRFEISLGAMQTELKISSRLRAKVNHKP